MRRRAWLTGLVCGWAMLAVYACASFGSDELPVSPGDGSTAETGPEASSDAPIDDAPVGDTAPAPIELSFDRFEDACAPWIAVAATATPYPESVDGSPGGSCRVCYDPATMDAGNGGGGISRSVDAGPGALGFSVALRTVEGTSPIHVQLLLASAAGAFSNDAIVFPQNEWAKGSVSIDVPPAAFFVAGAISFSAQKGGCMLVDDARITHRPK